MCLTPHPFMFKGPREASEMGQFLESAINRWHHDHEDIEDEMGIVWPQEDVPHVRHDEEPEDHEHLYHFR